jgi:phage terminase large subunit GpA-like protein
MVMAEIKTTKVQEVAAEIGMSYGRFIGRCLDSGMSFDTANDVWKFSDKQGFSRITQTTVARILRRPVDEIFPDA